MQSRGMRRKGHNLTDRMHKYWSGGCNYYRLSSATHQYSCRSRSLTFQVGANGVQRFSKGASELRLCHFEKYNRKQERDMFTALEAVLNELLQELSYNGLKTKIYKIPIYDLS